ncbi:MAG: class F sortase [Candidatus Staskawiczbacteria bacterium]|nr:class F sortase [Candidatus Staskawiczbacteria bacterium]
MKVNYQKIAVASILTAVSLLVLAGLVQAATFIPTNRGNLIGNAAIISRVPEKLINNKPVKFIGSIASLEQASLGISRLKIPTINVDALIEPMGVTQDGAMEAPSSAQYVGWYAFGPRPGENGSAVLAGHYGRWKSGDVSVFDNLHTLKPGDKLYVQDKDGITITFIVRQLRTYDKNDDTSEIFISDDGVSHLNIITCAGVYNETLKTYSDRLVVFTDKQSE